MRTDTLTQYIANDGTIFHTKKECEEYEASGTCLFNCMHNFVTENIQRAYNDDAGFYVIDASNVADFVLKHFRDIKDIIEMHKS